MQQVQIVLGRPCLGGTLEIMVLTKVLVMHCFRFFVFLSGHFAGYFLFSKLFYSCVLHLMFGLLIFCLIASLASAETLDLSFLQGRWSISVGDETTVGETISFEKSFGGFDAVFPFFEGSSSLSLASAYGGHIAITSRRNDKCYYYATLFGKREMTWSLRGWTTNSCPRSMLLRKVLLDENGVAVFPLEICNRSSVAVNVAVVDYFYEPEKRWLTRGWFRVLEGKCRELPVFSRSSDNVYVYAVGFAREGENNKRWAGADLNACVQTFNWNWDQTESDFRIKLTDQCNVNQVLRGFRRLVQKEPKLTFTLTD